MTLSEHDIGALRAKHENPTEWRLRREFIQRNNALLDPERLVCLSNCFINVKLYGASYPEKVMDDVRMN
ncbi:unnamed protein product [Protopolystoma xenopodis]|uniref:XRN2-binding (XTBD) domain-containing protein n=1 Tax=Protopolystoma xenopodis TaxID=117903 RepID=A0A3S5CVZ7_9PLAT|nr:unnamed protein product [Protopolystoma xenopodis]